MRERFDIAGPFGGDEAVAGSGLEACVEEGRVDGEVFVVVAAD